MHANATPARPNRESLRPNATYYLWALVPTLAGCTVTPRSAARACNRLGMRKSGTILAIHRALTQAPPVAGMLLHEPTGRTAGNVEYIVRVHTGAMIAVVSSAVPGLHRADGVSIVRGTTLALNQNCKLQTV